MSRLDPRTLREAADLLRSALDDHAAWHEAVLRALFCGDAGDATPGSPSAHRECAFGRWFYELAPNGLREYPDFAAAGREHRRLHQFAARMLRATRAGAPVARADFEALVAAHAGLRLHAAALRDAIDSALAQRDALTGACGRIEMLPHLHEQRAVVQRTGRPCSLVFMDLDNLKLLNDRYGHAVGDAVLRGAVVLLERLLRAEDRVFRYGGDEFLVALAGADLEAAQQVTVRLRESFATRLAVARPEGGLLEVSASFGLALLDPDAEVAESIVRADQALLLAKAGGRNRAVRWDASIQTSTHWRRLDVRELQGDDRDAD
jgi:diguanylate cyclase (GGDEF)-like protein